MDFVYYLPLDGGGCEDLVVVVNLVEVVAGPAILGKCIILSKPGDNHLTFGKQILFPKLSIQRFDTYQYWP